LAIAALCAALLVPALPAAAQTTAQTPAKTQAKVKSPMPTAQEIADAKAKGLVWVNLNSGVYHKGGDKYGLTKRGKFMAEVEAKKAGYRAPHTGPNSKKKAPAKSSTANK
jgi:hypothetical protein